MDQGEAGSNLHSRSASSRRRRSWLSMPSASTTMMTAKMQSAPSAMIVDCCTLCIAPSTSSARMMPTSVQSGKAVGIATR